MGRIAVADARALARPQAQAQSRRAEGTHIFYRAKVQYFPSYNCGIAPVIIWLGFHTIGIATHVSRVHVPAWCKLHSQPQPRATILLGLLPVGMKVCVVRTTYSCRSVL